MLRNEAQPELDRLRREVPGADFLQELRQLRVRVRQRHVDDAVHEELLVTLPVSPTRRLPNRLVPLEPARVQVVQLGLALVVLQHVAVLQAHDRVLLVDLDGEVVLDALDRQVLPDAPELVWSAPT